MPIIRFVPFKVNFDIIKKIDKYLNWLLYLTVMLGVLILILSEFPITGAERFTENSNYAIGTLSLFYFLGDLIKKFLLQLAEQRRRKDFIDNSLNTRLADVNSEGYYSNDQFDTGIYKMGINCFENSFFSMSISGKMIPKMIIQSLFIVLLFCLLLMTTDKITIATFMQFALPYTIIQQTIIIIIYHLQIGAIFNQFKLLFSSAREQARDLLLIHNVINYESTIAWAGVVLDDGIFSQHNNDLSQQWEQIKESHQIIPEG